MNHLFVSYETAKALKELGFDEPCFTWWYGEQEKYRLAEGAFAPTGLVTNGILDIVHNDGRVAAPTHQQVVDWLFDKHGLNVSMFPISKNQWAYEISFMETYPENYKDGHFYGNVDTQQVIDEILFKDNRGIKLPSLDEMAANNYGRYDAINAAIDEAIKLVQNKLKNEDTNRGVGKRRNL